MELVIRSKHRISLENIIAFDPRERYAKSVHIFKQNINWNRDRDKTSVERAHRERNNNNNDDEFGGVLFVTFY